MDKLNEKLWAAVEDNRENLVEMTQKLVSYYSPMGSEEKVQNYVSETLKELGLAVDMWEPDMEALEKHPTYYKARSSYLGSPNVVGVLKGSGGGKSLILNGHIDVVPGEPEKWKHGMDSGDLSEGRIYGRGTADMKGGCAANIIALKAILDAGIKLKGDLLIESVVEEETGGAGTLDTLLRGYTADAAIFPEPTDMKIYPVTMGAVWFRITVKGLPAHGALAYMGVSAIEKSVFLLEKIKEFEAKRAIEKQHPLYDYMKVPFCINVGKLNAGTWPSIVSSASVMEGRIGLSPQETMQSAKAEFEQMIRQVCAEDEWLAGNPPQVEWYGPNWNGGGVEADHPIVATVASAYTALKKEAPDIVGAPWPADAIFMTEFGIPAINFGPGEGSEAHQADESISVDHLVECTKILASTIVDWCGCEE